MIVYIITALISIFSGYIANRFKKQIILKNSLVAISDSYSLVKSYKTNMIIWFMFAFIPVFLVSGIRYGVGQDYFFTYVPVFNEILETGTYKNMDIGYLLINKILARFTSDYMWVFIVTSFIFTYFIYRSIFDQSDHIHFCIFLLFTSTFYFYSLNVVRQTMATSIFFYCIKYIKEKNFKKYTIGILLATSLHASAIIYLPVYFFSKINISLKKFLIVMVVASVVRPKVEQLMYLILSHTKYSYYVDIMKATGEYQITSPLMCFCIVLLAFYYKRKANNDEYYNIYLNIQIASCVISVYMGLFPLMIRLFTLFRFIEILFVPKIIEKEKNKHLRILMSIIIITLYIIYFIYGVGISNGNKVLPYRTIFSR